MGAEGGAPLEAGATRTRPVALTVWLVFLAFSAVHAPVPGPGEPHYLTKARHFCDPEWCAGDQFLESSNAHLVFYVAVGWLTRLVSLEATAWIGRALGFAVLAAGWTSLARKLVPGRWGALAAACLYAVASLGNLSGEWMLDGVEGKVFAYGLLFLGWARALDGRLITAGLALGAAVSFHPLVGGWGAVCGLAGGVFARVRTGTRGSWTAGGLAAGLAAFALAALPGVVPALSAVGGPQARQADYIQVFYRLPHHLDPKTIPAWNAVAYAALLAAWLVARRGEAREPGSPVPNVGDWWLGCVLASVMIALGGVAVGWGPRPATAENMPWLDLRLRLMKFYPFRMADVLIPVAAAFTAAGAAVRVATEAVVDGQPGRLSHGGRTRRRAVVGACGLALAFGLALGWETRFRPPIRPSRWAAWLDVCHWVRENTPTVSVFATPESTWAFKWYAERPEYFCFKDCPQDAAGIVEWNRRQRLLEEWAKSEFPPENADVREFSAESLRKLRRATGITHVLAQDLGPFAVPPVYRNEFYQVVSLPE